MTGHFFKLRISLKSLSQPCWLHFATTQRRGHMSLRLAIKFYSTNAQTATNALKTFERVPNVHSLPIAKPQTIAINHTTRNIYAHVFKVTRTL